MASTYTWSNLLDIVKPFIKSIPTSTLDVTVCDQLNSFVWKAFPWTWATFSLTSATSQLSLIDGRQDYPIGTTTAGGFYELQRVRITRTDVTPNIVREKDIVQWLAPNVEQQGGIDTIAAVATLGQNLSTQLRLDCAASVPTGTAYQIDGEYWALPIKVTSTASVIIAPDQYANVYIEGLKWKYYQLGDDKRAGAMTVNNDGRKAYTGQMGVFMAELQTMIDDEDYGGGFQQRFPANTMGQGKPGNPGLYGFF